MLLLLQVIEWSEFHRLVCTKSGETGLDSEVDYCLIDLGTAVVSGR